MKSIKIGSGAGYSDDRLEPALDIIRDGDVDYIVFECLAERTIAIAQQRKMKIQSKVMTVCLSIEWRKSYRFV